MPEQDVVLWTVLIVIYSQNDHPHADLAFFNEIMVSVHPACANFQVLGQSKQIYGYAVRNGFECDVAVQCACGHVQQMWEQ